MDRRNLSFILLLLCAAPVRANNIITAERPPIHKRGFTFQFDKRPTFVRSNTFVDRNGRGSGQSLTHRQFLSIIRLYTERFMLRASVPLVSQSANAGGRYGAGDAFFEAGALARPGPWRFRFLGFFKPPTGSFDKNQAVNIGSGQWDFGPSLYLTRYFKDKAVDVDFQTQYAFRSPNIGSGVRPGNLWTANLAAAREIALGIPLRIGIEHRALIAEPNRRDGAAVSSASRSLGVGPVAMLDMSRFVKGFSLWPTAVFDYHNRNSSKNRLYYLKIQLNY